MSSIEELAPVKVYAVRGERAAQALLDLVEPALVRAGPFTREDVLQELREHKCQGWIAEVEDSRGGAVTRVREYPNGQKELFVWLLGGEDFLRWCRPLNEAMERFAREMGCERLHAAVRPGLAKWLTKRLGWSRTVEMVELRL